MSAARIIPAVMLCVIMAAGCQSVGDTARLNEEISRLHREIAELKSDGRFSILFIGDIILVNHTKRLMRRRGAEYPFRKIRESLMEYDFVVGNLETPITRRGTPVRNRYYVFQLDPSLSNALKSIPLTAVTLGNNHLFDYGPEGVHDTVARLEELKIVHSGAGANLSEARRPVVLKHGYSNVYILSYCGRPPERFYATDDQPGTAPMDLKIITEDIERYKRYDNLVIVSLHWGIEQTHMVQKDQISLAHDIIDAGADAIIGHHPHWPQGIEIYRKRPILYSLGNFVNGHFNKVEKDNIMAAFHLNRNAIEAIEIIPIAGKNRVVKFQPYVLSGQEAKGNLMLLYNLSKYLKSEFEIIGSKGLLVFDR
ncbi:MAG: CapA family protein [Spirochaetes bacterium]|nr:CapA family protein [Spirochaetota bacterium]